MFRCAAVPGRLAARYRRLTAWVPAWLLLSLLVLGAGVGGYHLLVAVRFEYHYRAAGRQIEAEAFAEAGEHLAECLWLAPRSGRAHFRAARTARRSGQLEFAEEELLLCDDLGWPARAVELERALLAVQQGDLDPAREASLRRRVTADNPDRFLILDALAQGYMRAYRLMHALECLGRWVEGQPDSATARMRRGWVYERLDRLADAEADYRHVLATRPAHRPATLRLALVLMQQKRPADALPLLEALHDQPPADPALTLALAQCRLAVGHSDDARPLLDQLAALPLPDPAVPLEQGKLALRENRLEAARDWLRQAVSRAPQSYEAHYQLALALRRLGDLAGAAAAEERFTAIEGDLKRMGQLTAALQNRPDDPEVRLQIAEIFLRRGEQAEGVLWLTSVVRAAPNHARAHQRLADEYERTGQRRLARRHRQQALPPAVPAAQPKGS